MHAQKVARVPVTGQPFPSPKNINFANNSSEKASVHRRNQERNLLRKNFLMTAIKVVRTMATELHGEEHIEGDGNGEENECRDDEVDGSKDHDEEDCDSEEHIEGGGNGGISTASDSYPAASNI